MIVGATQPEGRLISPEFERQIRETVAEKLSSHLSVHEARRGQTLRRESAFVTYKVILDVTVPAISSPLAEVEGSTDPSQPNATICVWSARRRRWVQSGKRLACANDSDTEYSANNTAWAIPQAGVYFLGGCPEPVPNRPTPPWKETA